MAKEFYLYPALFTYEAEGGISVSFPDLPGCATCGETDEEAVSMAQEALELHLYGMEHDGDVLPAASSVKSLSVGHDQVVVLIRAHMALARLDIDNRKVKKTLTIPNRLNQLAEAAGVNFSQVLQNALQDILGLPKGA
jgi:predicted RNase H-like HicB family nuclease